MKISMRLCAMHAILLTDQDIDHIVSDVRDHLCTMRDEGCKVPTDICAEIQWSPCPILTERVQNYTKMIKKYYKKED